MLSKIIDLPDFST